MKTLLSLYSAYFDDITKILTYLLSVSWRPFCLI